MKRITPFILLSLAVLPTAQAASFDCVKAASTIDELICSDNVLSKLDETLNNSYQYAINQKVDKQKLIKEQRQWLKGVRNACHEIDCLRIAYKTRIHYLSQYINEASSIAGLFVTRADLGGARKFLCIAPMPDGRYDITVSAAYCPSKECMNARLDGAWSQQRIDGNFAHIVVHEGCELAITFKKEGAYIKEGERSTCHQTSIHPYLYAEGYYKFVRSELKDGDCSPSGGDLGDEQAYP